MDVNLSEKERLEAQFSLEDGMLNGFFTAQDQNEVMKFQELADTFREEAGSIWKVGSISVTTQSSAAIKDTVTAENSRT